MAYAPNVFGSTVPLPGNDNYIDGANGVAGNHNQVYVTHAPPVCEHAGTLSGIITSRSLYRFRHRGNIDAQTLTARVRASGAGSPTMSFTVDSAAAVTTGAVGADAWYTMDASPSAAVVHDCLISTTVPAFSSIETTRVNAYLAPAASAGRKRRSGWIYQNAVTYGADYATTVEHLERWQNGPIRIAVDRPLCVLSHLADIKTAAVGKSRIDWATINVDFYEEVGRAILPKDRVATSRYIVDAYLARCSGTGTITGALKIGATVIDVSVLDAWTSVELELPPGPVGVQALIQTGASTSAQFDCVQIWRI